MKEQELFSEFCYPRGRRESTSSYFTKNKTNSPFTNKNVCFHWGKIYIQISHIIYINNETFPFIWCINRCCCFFLTGVVNLSTYARKDTKCLNNSGCLILLIISIKDGGHIIMACKSSSSHHIAVIVNECILTDNSFK